MDLEGLQRDLTVVTEVTAGLARNAVDTLMTMQVSAAWQVQETREKEEVAEKY